MRYIGQQVYRLTMAIIRLMGRIQHTLGEKGMEYDWKDKDD